MRHKLAERVSNTYKSAKFMPVRWNRTIDMKNLEECQICMEDFKEGEEISAIACGADKRDKGYKTKQGHGFHKDCLFEWIDKTKDTPACPLCRAVINKSLLRTCRYRAPQPKSTPLDKLN